MEAIAKLICFLSSLVFFYNLYSIFQYLHRYPTNWSSVEGVVDSKEIFYLGLETSKIRHIQRIPGVLNRREKIQENIGVIFINMKRPFRTHFEPDRNTTSSPRYRLALSNYSAISNLIDVEPSDFYVLEDRLPTECLVHYPNNTKLKVNNKYCAFYDNRAEGRKKPDIRILGISSSAIRNVVLFCQCWFTEFHKAKVVKASKPLLFDGFWTRKTPKKTPWLVYIISCPLQGELKDSIPFAVSLVSKKCDLATNKLKVIHSPPQQKPPSGFAVCVKALDFPERDISLQLVEWIELLLLLGAEKIHTHVFAVHANIQKVLDHYQRKGVVEVRPLTLPGNLPNSPEGRHLHLYKNLNTKRHLELLPYNDCFYRLMYRYQYITLLDVDEVIIPLQNKTWKELLEVQLQTDVKYYREGIKPDSYQIWQNGCFFDGIKRPLFPEIPRTMHMLQHVYKIPPKVNQTFVVGMKAFIVPNRVRAVFNHFPHSCLFSNCRRVKLNQTLAQLQHYKNIHRHCNDPRNRRVKPELSECNRLDCLNYTVTDITLWKYKQELIPKFLKTVTAIFKDQPPTQWTE